MKKPYSQEELIRIFDLKEKEKKSLPEISKIVDRTIPGVISSYYNMKKLLTIKDEEIKRKVIKENHISSLVIQAAEFLKERGRLPRTIKIDSSSVVLNSSQRQIAKNLLLEAEETYKLTLVKFAVIMAKEKTEEEVKELKRQNEYLKKVVDTLKTANTADMLEKKMNEHLI